MEGTVDRDYDSEARAQGWKPQEEFQGEGWVDAKTFVERGDKYVGIVKDRLDKVERKLKYQETLNNDLKSHIDRQEKLHEKELNDVIKRLEAERERAIENNDGKAFSKADKALENAKLDKASLEVTKQNRESAPPVWEVEWLETNEWYKTDKAARAVADDFARSLAASDPTLQGKEFLEKVTEYTKTQLPHKFENQNKKRQPQVETEGSNGARTNQSSNGGGSQYSQLPKEAKDTFNRFVREGIYKDNDEARAKYARMYNE